MKKHRMMTAAAILMGIVAAGTAQGQSIRPDRAMLPVEVPPVVNRSFDLGETNPVRPLHLSVSLQPSDPEGLQAYADAVSDPTSVNYRNYLSPQQVGSRFGATQDQVNRVTNYLRGYGFNVSLVSKNHLSVLVEGTATQAEAAFHTAIRDFATMTADDGGDHGSYFSYATPLRTAPEVAPLILDVMGLENYTRPQYRALTPAMTRGLYDSATLYAGGTQGQGRNIGISNYDGFRLTNVPLYYAQYGLPTPTGGVGHNITVTAISGGAGSGSPYAEGDLDIQMVLGMAPLCNLTIYDGGGSNLIGVLTQEVSDNKCDIITESYGWSLGASTATAAHNQHLSMTAQGITYLAASGDSGTSIEPYSYPDYEPEVLVVGGTVGTVTAANQRFTEVGWSGSGGGWSTNTATFNTLPSWQKGTGVPTNINHRLVPDVSYNASGSNGAYPFYLNGSLTYGYVGTSFACPVLAGSLALAEQQLITLGHLPANSAGKQRLGRVQNLLYTLNGNLSVWNDITSGSNGTLPNGAASNATTGWDFVTGLGTLDINGFVASQAGVSTAPNAPTGVTATAGNAQVSLTWGAVTGATSYHVKRATVSGGPYTTVSSPTAASYVNTGLTDGTTYYYVVSAVNASGESTNSAQVSAQPFAPAPTNLAAVAGNAQVSLSWTASTGATKYNVKRGTASGGPYTTVASPTTTSYVNTGLTNGTTYYYVVTAVTAGGESANSNQASAQPVAPTAKQILLNPGFESGSANWTASSSGLINTLSGEPAHSGSYKAWLGGTGKAHQDTLYQQIAIPSTITTATYTFWIHIDTAETTTTGTPDTIQVQVRNTSNGVLTTLATYSNLNKATGYVQKTFNLAAYKGQTVRLYFVATEDSARQTSFVLDDFALNVL